MGVKTGCKPRDDVLQGDLTDAIFAASFGQLVRNQGPAVYRDPAHFFQNTFPTDALRSLCQRVFGSLADLADAGRFFRVSTGFGGGKTLALMALWYLAKNIADPAIKCASASDAQKTLGAAAPLGAPEITIDRGQGSRAPGSAAAR
jgi:predicted AAA+ superfamily ATPase